MRHDQLLYLLTGLSFRELADIFDEETGEKSWLDGGVCRAIFKCLDSERMDDLFCNIRQPLE